MANSPTSQFFIPTYSESKREAYTCVAFLLLDGALGEYNVEKRVGQIQVEAAPKSTVQTFSLETLPNAFDTLLGN